MANADGSWDTMTRSPMGTTEIKNGKIDGDKLTWTLDITVPMPMTLTGEATVDGDNLNGQVTAGAFGSFPMTGTRAA